MSYKVKLTSHALKELDRLRGDTYKRLESAINDLSENPRPAGCCKLENSVNQWRIRVGEYRIIYTIDDTIKEVIIYRIGHRRSIYEF